MRKIKKDFNFDISLKVYKDYSIIKVIGDFVPASRPRVSKFGSYIAEPYKSFKKVLSLSMQEKLKSIRGIFIGEPLSIDITFNKLIPKSYTKELKEKSLERGCTKRPDLDNYFKAILDSLENTIFSDDSYVVELSGRKIYSEVENSIIIVIKKFILKKGHSYEQK